MSDIKNTNTTMKVSKEKWDEIFKKEENSEKIQEVPTRKKSVKKYIYRNEEQK